MRGRLVQCINVKTLGMFCILALLPVLAFGDPLWKKAVQIAGGSSVIYPGTMVEHERVYDLHDRLVEYTRSEYRLRFDLRQGLQVRLVKAVKNNVDITAKKAKEPLDPADLLTGEDKPFDPAVHSAVTARRARAITLDGRQVAVYTYRQQTPDARWQGEAYLVAATGVPVKIEASTDHTITESKMKLSNRHMTVHYTTRPDGSWVQGATLLTMDITMAGFRGKVKTEIEFTDFRR